MSFYSLSMALCQVIVWILTKVWNQKMTEFKKTVETEKKQTSLCQNNKWLLWNNSQHSQENIIFGWWANLRITFFERYWTHTRKVETIHMIWSHVDCTECKKQITLHYESTLSTLLFPLSKIGIFFTSCCYLENTNDIKKVILSLQSNG